MSIALDYNLEYNEYKEVYILSAYGLPALLKGLEDCLSHGYTLDGYFDHFSTNGSIFAEYTIRLLSNKADEPEDEPELSEMDRLAIAMVEAAESPQEAISIYEEAEDTQALRDSFAAFSEELGVKLDRRSVKTLPQMINRFNKKLETG